MKKITIPYEDFRRLITYQIKLLAAENCIYLLNGLDKYEEEKQRMVRIWNEYNPKITTFEELLEYSIDTTGGIYREEELVLDGEITEEI